MPFPSPVPTTIPIVLLKTASTPHDPYHTYLTSSSSSPPFAPQFIPVLSHTFFAPALAHLRTLLTHPPSPFPYGGLILTSQRAVEALASVLGAASEASEREEGEKGRKVGATDGEGAQAEEEAERETRSPALALPLYTVGPATARALAALRDRYLPRCRVEGAEAGNGEKLAAYILQKYCVPSCQSPTATKPTTPTMTATAPAGGCDERKAPRPPLLFLVGETRRDVIPTTLTSTSLPAQQRVRVEELVVYESKVVQGFGKAFAQVLGDWETGAGKDGKGRTLWVVVFSPAGCGEMVRVLRGVDDDGSGFWRRGGGEERRIFVASIGPTTRDYLLQEFGFTVDVCAEKPSPEGLGQGIERFMRERGL